MVHHSFNCLLVLLFSCPLSTRLVLVWLSSICENQDLSNCLPQMEQIILQSRPFVVKPFQLSQSLSPWVWEKITCIIILINFNYFFLGHPKSTSLLVVYHNAAIDTWSISGTIRIFPILTLHSHLVVPKYL